jgi:hypothetical protein
MDFMLAVILSMGAAGFVILLIGMAIRVSYPNLGNLTLFLGYYLIVTAASWSVFWYYGFMHERRYGG